MPVLLAVLSAALLAASFPPLNLFPVVWVALVPLLIALDRLSSRRAAFGAAWLAGFLFFTAALFWIRYVTLAGLLVLTAYLALYVGVFGLIHRWGRTLFSGMSLWKKGGEPIFLAALWAALEAVRGTAFTGFNWGSLGHTQAETPLVALAPFTGVGGLTFLVVLVNVLLKEAVVAALKPGERQRGVRHAAVAAVLLAGLFTAGLLRQEAALPENSGLRIAVVQPDIALAEAWDPLSKPGVVRRLLAMSRAVLPEQPGLIIWPETAFPQFVWDLPELFDEVKAFARDVRVPLLIGTVMREDGKYYNAAVLIGPDGEVKGWRGKRHLVLFGEYIPFRRELPFLSELAPIDDFTPGPQDAIVTLSDGTRLGVLVCFEDTLPRLARRYVRAGAQVLVNMTNDAWFRDSGQPRMHLNNALFRAAETRTPLVRATNTGESCFIDALGRVEGCVTDALGRRVLVSGTLVRTVFPVKLRRP